MTESEYVQAIRDSASAYVDVIRNPDNHKTDGKAIIGRWWTMKENLSAHLIIDLCNLRLASSNTSGDRTVSPPESPVLNQSSLAEGGEA